MNDVVRWLLEHVLPREGRLRASYRLCAAYAVFLGTLTFLVQTSGLARVALTPTVAWCFLLASAVGGLAFDRWNASQCRLPSRPLFATSEPPMSRAWWLAAVLAIAAYALLWVPAYCRPDMTWDGMTYHVPTIHLWARKGYVHWIEVDPIAGDGWLSFVKNVFNGYPKGGEVIAFELARLSSDKLLNAPNLVFLPLAFFGVAFIARELGAARPLAVMAGFLFTTVPTNVAQSSSTYVDTAFASATIAFLALNLAQMRSATAWGSISAPVVVASGAALGLALGLKAPALAIGGIGALALIAAAVVRSRLSVKRVWRRLKALAPKLAVMGAVTIAVGGFWYIRNAVYTGNPIHPVEVKVLGHVLIPGVPLEEQITEVGCTPEFMRPWSLPKKIAYAWRQGGSLEWPIDAPTEHTERGYPIFDIPENAIPAWPRSIRYSDSRSGGLGVLWFYGGLPAIVFVLAWAIRGWRGSVGRARVRRGRTLLLIGLYFGCVALFFRAMPMSWWARYTLWLHGAGLPALALAVHATTSTRAWRRLVAGSMSVAWLGLIAVSFFEYLYGLKWSQTAPYFLGPPSTASVSSFWRGLTTTKDNGAGAMWHELDGLGKDALTGDATIGVSNLGISSGTLLGQLSMPVGKRNWILVDSSIGKDPKVADKFVFTYFPRYIIWDHWNYGPPPTLLASATRWEWLGPLMIFEFGAEKTPPPPLTPK